MIAWAVLLYFAGLLLVFAEFFVPGGICGFFGGVAVIISCALLCYLYPQYAIFIAIGQFAGILAGVLVGFKVLPKTRVGRSIILETAQKIEEGWVDTVSDEALVGRIGEVFTPMRPAGTIQLDGKRFDAVSNGTHIEKGAKVRVLEVRGNRIVVEEVESNREGAGA